MLSSVVPMKDNSHFFRCLRIAVLAAPLCCLISDAGAANKYVRAGASGAGTGDDWTNAYTDLPTTLVRGDVYYLATGTYGTHNFNDANAGTLTITVQKATAGNHGTDTGWQSSFGTGEAVFTTTSANTLWVVTTGYYNFEGVFGYGKQAHGFGIRLTSAASRSSQGDLVDWGGTPGVSGPVHCNFNHIELDWNNGTPTVYNLMNQTVISGEMPSSYVTFYSCFFHDAPGYCFYMGQWSGAVHRPITDHLVIDHCYFYNNGGGGGPNAHWELFWFTDNRYLTVSNNVIENVFGPIDGQTGWLMVGACQNVYIYGNLFFSSSPNTVVGGNGVIATWSSDDYKCDSVHIINNTFANIDGGYGGHILFAHNTVSDTNIVAKNNLYYEPSNWSFTGLTTQDHEAFGGGVVASGSNAQTGLSPSQFVDYSARNYHLGLATLPGDSGVGAPYNIDPDGKTRGAGGIWDRGAYEYGLGSQPSAPANLRIASE
jgi:hypothetical protein